jgi:hypothetical protein
MTLELTKNSKNVRKSQAPLLEHLYCGRRELEVNSFQLIILVQVLL